MNIWIIDSNRGINLLYYSSVDLPINEFLVSGLLSALNQLTLIEFQQPIESIDMGGFKWLYINETELDLLFVAADKITISTDELKGRLTFIKDLFIRQMVGDKDKWKASWNGDVERFKPFAETIEVYYSQWSKAESVDTLAIFYDILGVLQEFLNFSKNIIDKNVNEKKKDKIYDLINERFENLKRDENTTKEKELCKAIFSKEFGFNIFEINPMNSDVEFILKQLKIFTAEVISLIIKELGRETIVNYYLEEGVFSYIYANLNLLKKLDLDDLLLKYTLLQ